MRVFRRMVGVLVGGALSVLAASCARAGCGRRLATSSINSAAEDPFNPAEKTVSVSNVGSLQTSWVRQFPTAQFISVPLVSDGHLFSIISGGVISMKATTGKTRWRIQLSGANSARIGTANGVVYVTTLDRLYALDAATGAQIWEAQGPFGNSSIVISGGTVYLGNVVVYAIDAATGVERWHYNTVWGDPFPIIANGVVYTRQMDQLVALDADTGNVLWTVPDRIPLLLYKTTLYSYYSGLHALDAATGATKWTQEKICCAIAAANGRVYSPTPDGWSALNAGTGNILWSLPPHTVVGDAMIANGVIYTSEDPVGGEGTIHAHDATTGAELATLPGHAGPVVSHGTVYTVDNHVNDDGAPTLYAMKP